MEHTGTERIKTQTGGMALEMEKTMVAWPKRFKTLADAMQSNSSKLLNSILGKEGAGVG